MSLWEFKLFYEGPHNPSLAHQRFWFTLYSVHLCTVAPPLTCAESWQPQGGNATTIPSSRITSTTVCDTIFVQNLSPPNFGVE